MSKRFRLLGYLLILSFFLISSASAQEVSTPEGPPGRDSDFVSDQILVRFHPGVSAQRADKLLAERGLTPERKIDILDIHVLRLPPGLSVERAVEIYSRLPEVDYAEPNYILHAVGPTQDEIDDQWGLLDIEAPRAWDEIDPKISVTIAIVDTGIDPNHTDLAANIWNNTDEILGNGIDDDNNGAIDDSWGWDFVNSDDDPMDDMMHGTAVSSIAAGVQDGSGVAGVCPWCQVIAVKVLDANGVGTLDVVATGIRYAADSKAKVINLSLGGTTGSQTLQNAVDYAWGKGSLVVAAAGNNGADILFYPAAYTNAIAVAATNDQDYRACFSNYGENFIDVAAPGEAIYHAMPEQSYGTNSGTSVASPHVAGLGGLLFSQNIARTNADVRPLIETTTEDLGPVGTDPYFGTGRINAYRAVMDITDPTTPPTGWFVTDLSSSGFPHARKLVRAGGNLHMVYHSQVGTNYQVLYAVSSDNGANWSLPEAVFSSPAETYHVALSTDGSSLFLAFPSMQGGPNYSVYYTRKSLPDGGWTTPEPLMGGTYNAVRPDLYYDASTGVLHLVGSSYDDAGVVYYKNSGDGGLTWGEVVNVSIGGSLQNSRYASVHAYGETVTIAGRSVELWYGIAPYFRVFTTQSLNNGADWGNPIIHSEVLGLLANEYGLSLAGQGDELRLVYEHSGDINFRTSTGGASWTTWETIGNGAWPTLTQAGDGQTWVMWVNGGILQLRHNVGGVWNSVQPLDTGEYPNLMLPPENDRIEWVATQCSGAPFRMSYGYQLIGVSENNPPVADDQPVSTPEDTAVSITLTASDPENDPLTFILVDLPSNGDLTGSPLDLTYTPDQDYNGPDSFTFKANDGSVDSNEATVSITVSAVNDPPVAEDQSVTTDEDVPVVIPKTATDVDDTSLTFQIEIGPSHGVLTDGLTYWIYDPDQDYYDTDSFTFTANDGVDDSNTTTVSITVNSINDRPVAYPQTVSTGEDTPVDITLTGSDVEGIQLEYLVVAGPAHGSLTGTGQVRTYTPAANYTGQDSFAFLVNDGPLDSEIVVVNINVVAGTMHIGDLGGSVSKSKATWTAVVTILVHDGAEGAVQGAVVHGAWDVSAIEATCTTDLLGYCTIYNEKIHKRYENTVFTVTDLTSSSRSYQAGDNHDSIDGDSSGTAIQVNQDGTTQDPGNTETQAVSPGLAVSTLHVGDLDNLSKITKGRWNAAVLVYVHNQDHILSGGVIVDGEWDGGIQGTDSCTTTEQGQCLITRTNLKMNIPDVTFTITNLTHGADTYHPGSNHDLDFDTDGTTISVFPY